MSYLLWHFPIRGRAEQIRLLFHALEIAFEQRDVTAEILAELRSQGPDTLSFGQIPLLEDGDFRLVQGPAIMAYVADKHGVAPTDRQMRARADAIVLGAEDLRTKFFQLLDPAADEVRAQFLATAWPNRWLHSFDGLLKLNGDTGFFVGSAFSHADIAVWDALDAVLTHVAGASLAGSRRLEDFHRAIAAKPGVAAYIGKGRLPSAKAALYGS